MDFDHRDPNPSERLEKYFWFQFENNYLQDSWWFCTVNRVPTEFPPPAGVDILAYRVSGMSFDVSVECMSRSWPGEVAELSGGRRCQRKNAFYLNATVNTTMPHYIVPRVIHGLNLEFDIVLWANYEWGSRI
ncbi:hypothetical protein ACP275_14G020700 [Erythranthe tilingii]